ncbi:MAG TPA: NUDIX hydrolase [Candidatus Moranbacteria bacterium]|nr:NUDIX hydrolase [Candidatus Moranbacteria bacterium]
MEKHQRIGVGAFLFSKGRILILKRSKKEKLLPGFWDIPGGKMEFGETPEEALKREAKEEINLDIELIAPCSVFSYITMKGKGHNVDIQYLVKTKESMQNIELMDEHEEYRWINHEELKKLSNVSNEMKRALSKGFEMYNKLKLNL